MQVKLTSILVCLAKDCAVDTFTISYLLQRLKSEGLGLLTVTLPKLAKAVIRSIEIGKFDYKDHPELSCFARKGRSLRHFRSFLDRIFAKNGELRPDACPDTIRRLRQFCEYAYKLACRPDEDEYLQNVYSFLAVDEEVGSYAYDWDFIEKLRKDFETFYPEISRSHVWQILASDRPRPGSGSFSDDTAKQKASAGFPWFAQKWVDFNYRPEHAAFSGYFKPYPSAPVRPRGLKDTSDVSELLFVPKDSRGPRAIVREPFRRLCLQMAFHDWITDALEKATHNRVNFRDQSINQRLAEESSKDQEKATLDLKEASDRVAYLVMQRIFRYSPGCRFMLENRSKEVKCLLTSDRKGPFIKHKLRKVAGMGSGLTFPLMSLLITLSISREVVNYYPHLRYDYVRSQIYVYGDDIVVPSKWYELANRALARVGLVVNKAKSFVNSRFRESCGADYYNGVDVAPVRLRLSSVDNIGSGDILLSRKLDPDGIEVNPLFPFYLLERHCRELVVKGLTVLSEYYYDVIEKEVGVLPYVAGESPVLGRYCSGDADCYVDDEFGNSESVRVLIPIPRLWDTVDTREHAMYYRLFGKPGHRRKTVFKPDPYIWLSHKLRERRFDPWSYTGCSTDKLSRIALPRDVKIVRRVVPALMLLG